MRCWDPDFILPVWVTCCCCSQLYFVVNFLAATVMAMKAVNVSLDFSVAGRGKHDDWIKFFIGPRGRVCVLLHAASVVAVALLLGLVAWLALAF